ncbi:MAG: hypothetical protein ACREBS_07125 [Nitrososphaerales archaeon]
MAILVFLAFNVKHNRRAQFAQWITQRETTSKDLVPKGWKYRGTYCTRFSHSELEYAMLLEIDKYARLDDFLNSQVEHFALMRRDFANFLDGTPQWTFYQPSSLKPEDDS